MRRLALFLPAALVLSNSGCSSSDNLLVGKDDGQQDASIDSNNQTDGQITQDSSHVDVVAVLPPNDAGGPDAISILPPDDAGGPDAIAIMPPYDAGGPDAISILPPDDAGAPDAIAIMPPYDGGEPDAIAVLPPNDSGKHSFHNADADDWFRMVEQSIRT